MYGYLPTRHTHTFTNCRYRMISIPYTIHGSFGIQWTFGFFNLTFAISENISGVQSFHAKSQTEHFNVGGFLESSPGSTISTIRYMIKSKVVRCSPLLIQGFSNFLGLFHVIMANPVLKVLPSRSMWVQMFGMCWHYVPFSTEVMIYFEMYFAGLQRCC